MGLTQEEFGVLGRVKKHAQYNYEKGDRLPDAGYLAAVAVHGVDVVYVLTGVRMDEQTKDRLMQAIQFSVRLGDADLARQSLEAAEAQAAEIRRQELMNKLEKLSPEDVRLLLQMADRIAKP